MHNMNHIFTALIKQLLLCTFTASPFILLLCSLSKLFTFFHILRSMLPLELGNLFRTLSSHTKPNKTLAKTTMFFIYKHGIFRQHFPHKIICCSGSNENTHTHFAFKTNTIFLFTTGPHFFYPRRQLKSPVLSMRTSSALNCLPPVRPQAIVRFLIPVPTHNNAIRSGRWLPSD